MKDRETTANRVAQIIAGRVLDGSYEPGASLREVALAAELSVSRSSIREALRILERDGVVRIEAHRGASVTRLTPDELIEIYQVRAVLLGLAMGLCARRRSDRELQALTRLHAKMGRALDDGHPNAAGLHARLSGEMALLIISSAGNRRLEGLLTQMAQQIARYTRLGLSTRSRRQQSAATWTKVLDALTRQDSQTAEGLGKQLVTETLRHALERIAALEPGPGE